MEQHARQDATRAVIHPTEDEADEHSMYKLLYVAVDGSEDDG